MLVSIKGSHSEDEELVDLIRNNHKFIIKEIQTLWNKRDDLDVKDCKK